MERTFTVGNAVEKVDDIMIGIPHMFRDEFIGAKFESFDDLSKCLMHADAAKRAKFESVGWLYEKELQAMREYLKA